FRLSFFLGHRNKFCLFPIQAHEFPVFEWGDRIVDAQGRLMTAESTFELINGINELSLPTEGLADGLYSVQVVYSSLANKGLHGAFIKTLPLTIRK
ncbi:MAG: hypothetical protein ACKO7X_01610, partial [Bacteroidota bacterium]